MSEYRLIRDMTYEKKTDDSLAYSSPCRGMWNIVHIGTQVPHSHQIFVCPTSCLRGVVLTTAEMGAMDRLSTIAVGEDNILEGDMEETLQKGVEKVIATLPEKPRMILIFISCIHHFLAANYQRVYRILRKKYPDIDFVDAYMDPIMRKKTPPIPCLIRQIYRVMENGEKNKRQVNYIGNWFSSPAHNDMTVHLRNCGIDVRDLAAETDYDRFRQMQKSSVNLTFHNYAARAGKDLEIRLGQKWIRVRPSFDYDEIDADMAAVCEELSIPLPEAAEIRRLREQVEAKAAELKRILGDTMIAVDYTAVDQPLGLCLFLNRLGFRLDSCFIESLTELEEVFLRLQRAEPELKIYLADDFPMRRMRRGHEGEILAIGQKAAYYKDTTRFVNIINGADLYGYRGILHLLDLMEDACLHEKDTEVLIQQKGLGCRAK
uniref:nitrogenase component 1 n=1 Tax=Eubacterium cellulosolvens TaxID=29322 RepID=UPI00055226C2|nr:nitrogenase component 1 [[Eubacterium] cellulosolvens]